MDMKKYLSKIDINRIINIYDHHKLSFLPKILNYSLQDTTPFIDFDWIDGKVVEDENLSDAFYKLGLMHKECQSGIREIGFTTICHGDFHRNNIIKNQKGLFFVDVTYIKEDWNYSDLDYLDLYDLFPKEKYPWFIKDNGCFDAYLEGIEVKYNEMKKDCIK
jgi:tRNA A-37 threonylcarbamoyl transferase component Bud32